VIAAVFIAGLLAGLGLYWLLTRRMSVEFKALSADALRDNRSDFLQQAREDLVKPLRESLEKVDARILELEKARAGAYGALGEQLKSLGSAQAMLQAETARLSTALRSTSYAGSWGELQLRRVVEMADMLPHCDFAEQETSGSLRADMVIRLPGGGRIVVDAKAPVESFRLASEATDEGARAARLSEHAAKVRGHIDSLGAKNYWAQFQPGPDFVVLFLPGDHLLSSALLSDPSLLDRAHGKHVLLASPTTLIALLKAAAYGWNQEALSRNAEEIRSQGRLLYDRVAGFAEYLGKVGAALDNAVKGYNSAVGSFEQTLLPGARRFAELGARGSKELKDPENVDTALRAVEKKS
jgi:DNA recombination protein RmuC